MVSDVKAAGGAAVQERAQSRSAAAVEAAPGGVSGIADALMAGKAASAGSRKPTVSFDRIFQGTIQGGRRATKEKGGTGAAARAASQDAAKTRTARKKTPSAQGDGASGTQGRKDPGARLRRGGPGEGPGAGPSQEGHAGRSGSVASGDDGTPDTAAIRDASRTRPGRQGDPAIGKGTGSEGSQTEGKDLEAALVASWEEGPDPGVDGTDAPAGSSESLEDGEGGLDQDSPGMDTAGASGLDVPDVTVAGEAAAVGQKAGSGPGVPEAGNSAEVQGQESGAAGDLADAGAADLPEGSDGAVPEKSNGPGKPMQNGAPDAAAGSSLEGDAAPDGDPAPSWSGPRDGKDGSSSAVRDVFLKGRSGSDLETLAGNGRKGQAASSGTAPSALAGPYPGPFRVAQILQGATAAGAGSTPDGAAGSGTAQTPAAQAAAVHAAAVQPSGAVQRQDAPVPAARPQVLDFGEGTGRWASQMAQAIRSQLRTGGSQLRMVIRPPTLGEIELKMSMRGNTMRLGIDVESNSVRHLLGAGADDLRSSLRNAGIELEKLHITVNEREGRRQEAQDGGGGSGGGRRNPADSPSGQESHAGGLIPAGAAAGPAAAQGLDFQV